MNTGDIAQVDLDLIDLDMGRWRTPAPSRVDRMTTSFKQHGQLTPVVIVEGRQGPLLVDGFKRYRAARALTWPSLQAIRIAAEPGRAKAMTYLLNRGGGFSIIQEALLVRELVEIDGLTMSEAAVLCNRHKSWVSRRMTMIRQLLPQVVTDLCLELIPSGSGPSLARLPTCNQADFAAVIQREGLSAGQIAHVTDLFCKAGDPGVRQFILAHPKAALEQIKKPTPSGNTDISLLMRILARMEAYVPQDLKESVARLKAGLVELQHRLEVIHEQFE